MPTKTTHKSARFRISSCGNYLLAVVLALLLLGLLGTFIIVGLSVLGMTPGV